MVERFDGCTQRAMVGAVADTPELRECCVDRSAFVGTDHIALRGAVDALNHATGEFAARRMDRSVSRALTGRRVDALSD